MRTVERTEGHSVPFWALFDASGDALLLVDDDFRITDVNPAAESLLVQCGDALKRRDGRSLLPERHLDWPSFLERGHAAGEVQLAVGAGQRRRLRFTAQAGVLPGRHLVALRDVTEQARAESRLFEQNRILTLMARRGGFTGLLDEVCAFVERELAGASSSVLLYDGAARVLRHGAVAGLPATFWRSLAQVPVGPRAASLGAAAFRREPVFTADIATDEVWEDCPHLRDLAVRHGLKACWAVPVLDGSGAVLGVLAVYTSESRNPTADERALIDLCAGLAALAIEQRNTDSALRKERSFVSNVLQSAGSLVVVLDLSGRVVRFNGACQKVSGFSIDEIRGRALWESLVPPDEAPAMRAFFEQARAGVFPPESESHWVTKGGEVRLMAWANSALEEKDGSVKYLVQTGADITERRRAEEALRESEERYRMLFTRNLAGVYRSRVSGELLDCNDAFARTFGYDSREEILRVAANPFFLDPRERDAHMRRLLELRFLTNVEFQAKRRDGRPIWVLGNESFVEGRGGEADTLLGTLVDITDRKRAEEELQRLAYHDALTNLPNRRLFDDRLEVALSQARYSRQTVAVLFVDLDRFKVINDSLGHKAGDQLLELAAQRLRETVFEGDTVARRGGDEFLLLLPRLTSPRHVNGVARKILKRFREPFNLDGHQVFVTLSMGVSLFPMDGDNAETLIGNADAAMYRAKQLGRDNYQIYMPVMSERAAERMELETGLHRALTAGELCLHFQPIVDLRSGRVAGTEALVRWHHPSRGLLQPGDFIPLAEETGLIAPIGAWTLEAACERTRSLLTQGFDLRVAVNLSARQFREANLATNVDRLLARTSLPPDRLELEITETIAMGDVEETRATLRDLKDLGVHITLDDFGTGYSSLSYLKRFPIDRLKIDRSFIQDVTTNPRDFAIAVATIAIAHGLKLEVIAEGVETEAQREFLTQQGCDYYQGYIFARPLPFDELEALLKAEGRTGSASS